MQRISSSVVMAQRGRMNCCNAASHFAKNMVRAAKIRRFCGQQHLTGSSLELNANETAPRTVRQGTCVHLHSTATRAPCERGRRKATAAAHCVVKAARGHEVAAVRSIDVQHQHKVLLGVCALC